MAKIILNGEEMTLEQAVQWYFKNKEREDSKMALKYTDGVDRWRRKKQQEDNWMDLAKEPKAIATNVSSTFYEEDWVVDMDSLVETQKRLDAIQAERNRQDDIKAWKDQIELIKQVKAEQAANGFGTWNTGGDPQWTPTPTETEILKERVSKLEAEIKELKWMIDKLQTFGIGLPIGVDLAGKEFITGTKRKFR